MNAPFSGRREDDVGDFHILFRQSFRGEQPGSGLAAGSRFPTQLIESAAQLGKERKLSPPGGKSEQDALQQSVERLGADDQEALVKLIEAEQPELGTNEARVEINMMKMKPETLRKVQEFVKGTGSDVLRG